CSLSFIGITDHFRERTIVTDGAREDERNVIFYAAVHDTIVDIIVVDKLSDGTALSYPVDDIQVIIMSVWLGFLCVDILPESSVEHSPLKIVSCQGISRHQTVHVSVFHHRLHSASCVRIEGKGRSHYPENISVFFFIFQKLEEAVIISCVGCLPASALTEDKL